MEFEKKNLFLCVLFSCFFISECSAYIDPGTGSFIIQLLVAGFLGALYALKVFWRQVIAFLTKTWFKIFFRK